MVGKVLHKLTSKCDIRVVLPDALEILSPQQLGIGLPAVILHLIMNVLADYRFTLLVDFSKALNFVNWAAIIHKVMSQLPTSAS